MNEQLTKMDRNLALETVRVTEAAALAASRWMGRGDEKAADQAAVDAMRTALNSLGIRGTVRIGEGERDEAPMLFIGEEVGLGDGPEIDIALDPWRGPRSRLKGAPMLWRSLRWQRPVVFCTRRILTWKKLLLVTACRRGC